MALKRQGMDLWGFPVGLALRRWQWSPVGGRAVDWARSGAYCRCLIGLGSEDFGGLGSFLCYVLASGGKCLTIGAAVFRWMGCVKVTSIPAPKVPLCLSHAAVFLNSVTES